MLSVSSVKKIVVSGFCILCISSAYAYEAPVYDVDQYPPNFGDHRDAGTPAAKTSPSTEDTSSQTSADDTAADDQTDEDTTPSSASSSALPRSVSSSSSRVVDQQASDLQTTKAKVDALQTDVQTLRGQVEELTHHLQQMETQQRTMYLDFDKRLSALQNAPVQPAAAQPAKKGLFTRNKVTPSVSSNPVATNQSSKTEQPNVAEEQQTYQQAYDLIKAAKYDQAITTLQKMLNKYPSGQFAANAHYWLGELYGLQGKNEQSASEFSTVIKQYPDSPKMSDAQLKLGLIYAAQQKWSLARAAFKKVIDHYPGTASSRLASEQLKQIKLAGH